jgi:hypothetical protein
MRCRVTSADSSAGLVTPELFERAFGRLADLYDEE